MTNSKTITSFTDGWRVLYQARTVFSILLIIVLLVNIGLFITAWRSPNLIRPVVGNACMLAEPKNPTSLPSTAPAVSPASASPELTAQAEVSTKYTTIFSNLLTMTQIVALVSVVFLLFCALLGILMVIAGQLPGAGVLTGAFFWAVGIVALVLPWSNILPQCMYLPLGMPAFNELHSALHLTSVCGEGIGHAAAQVSMWLKFVVFPVIIILFDVLYIWRTRQADNQIDQAPQMIETPSSIR